MHQIRFRLGLRPRLHWEAHGAFLDPLTGLFESHFKGKEGWKGGRSSEGREREGECKGCKGSVRKGRKEVGGKTLWI